MVASSPSANGPDRSGPVGTNEDGCGGNRMGLDGIQWDLGIHWGSGKQWGLDVLLFSLFQFLDEVVCTGDCVGDETFH